MRPRGPFQAAVLATFDRRRWIKFATLPTLFGTLLLSLALPRQSDPYLLYAEFFGLTSLTALFFYVMSGRKSSIVSYEGARVSEWIPQVLGMLALMLLVAAGVLAVRGASWRSPAADWETIVLFVIVVAVSEEWARWVWLHTLPYSPLTANLLWVLLHRNLDATFLVFALAFGLAMFALLWLRESLPRRYGRYFGPLAAVTVHAAYDAIVLLWALTISGVQLVPF